MTGELDRELVGDLLRPYLRIDRDTCEVIPLSGWDGAPNEVRVLFKIAPEHTSSMG